MAANAGGTRQRLNKGDNRSGPLRRRFPIIESLDFVYQLAEMRSKGHGQNKFVRFITVPFRALGKARDLYVRSLTSCASSVSFGQGSGDYTGQYSGLPRSFSASSAISNDNEDLRELIRAASVRSLGHENEIEMFLQEQLRQMRSKGLPKSCSVGMGRIDEDKPCEFEENEAAVVEKKKQDFLYPRSKSYAVTKRSVSFDSY
ncbi:uncharacterized protein LOC111310821 [Durio zibethinus]|uniref:Uncharacterized protein LOC111310821 n=1 Tax=Durio zibethinus TaxID=66656 RepID=A0A6P6AM53_DURZI|nr:uncharacterized protein LOC111310821 [Durio zibethinus]